MAKTATATKAVTPQAKAVELAKAQVAAGHLPWVQGYGYKGLNYKAIMASTGLKYRAAYIAVMVATMPASERIATATAQGAPVGDATLAQAIAHAHVVQHQSWGYIMMRTANAQGQFLSVGRVQRLFATVTGYQALGMRTGKGGRMVTLPNGKPNTALYTGGARKGLGSELKVGTAKANAKPTVKHVLPTQVK